MTVRARRWPAAIATLAALTVMAACTDDADTTGAAQTITSLGASGDSTTTLPDDGVLRIGVLLPRSGSGAPFGEPLVAAVDIAIAEINAAGGVNGRPVEVVAADEGDSVATAAKAVGELIDARVDAVVGPASSRIALGVLGQLVDQRVFTCSPTATASALSDFPDESLFVRTIAADQLQAIAMAEVIEGAGVDSAAVMTPDDRFGREYADELSAALARRGIRVTSVVRYTGNDEDHTDEVVKALVGPPDAVALIGNSVSGRQVLDAIDEVAPEGLAVVVNDALRRPASIDADPALMQRADVVGTSPRSSPAAAWFTTAVADRAGVLPADAPVAFGANAYDCVSLIATAAEAAGANSATAIAANVRIVSSGGANCGNFATCRDFLEQGRNIDLNGASGPLELDVAGDVTVGLFDRFRFDESGRDVTVGELQIS